MKVSYNEPKAHNEGLRLPNQVDVSNTLPTAFMVDKLNPFGDTEWLITYPILKIRVFAITILATGGR